MNHPSDRHDRQFVAFVGQGYRLGGDKSPLAELYEGPEEEAYEDESDTTLMQAAQRDVDVDDTMATAMNVQVPPSLYITVPEFTKDEEMLQIRLTRLEDWRLLVQSWVMKLNPMAYTQSLVRDLEGAAIRAAMIQSGVESSLDIKSNADFYLEEANNLLQEFQKISKHVRMLLMPTKELLTRTGFDDMPNNDGDAPPAVPKKRLRHKTKQS